jgi:hypothetical protein
VSATDKITARNAANALFHVGKGGYPGSGFIVQLLRCIEKADSPNLARLALGFPGLVAAYQMTFTSEGLHALELLAEQDEGHDESFGEGPAHVELGEREQFAVRWTGYKGALKGAPLAVQIDTSLHERHARQHAAEIRGWQPTAGIAPDAEPVSRTTFCASTPWLPLSTEASQALQKGGKS